MKHYAVRNRETKKFHRQGKVVQFFKNKEEAKAKRKELNGINRTTNDENFSTGWVVSGQEIEA